MSAHRTLTTRAARLWKNNRSRIRWAKMPKDEFANQILDLAVIGLAGAAINKLPLPHAEMISSAFSLAFGPEKSQSTEPDIIDAEFVEIKTEKKR